MASEARDQAPEERTSMLVDYGPLVVFVLTYKIRDIYWATGAFMVATVLALALAWIRDRKLRPMPLVTGAVVMVFGGMTIWFSDPRFIYVKPTIVTALMGLVLLGGLAFGRPLLKPLLGSALELRDEGWRALSLRFALFSLVLAGINELVWRNVAEHVWVWFKFLGIPGLTLLFFVTQSAMLKRFRVEGQAAE